MKGAALLALALCACSRSAQPSRDDASAARPAATGAQGATPSAGTPGAAAGALPESPGAVPKFVDVAASGGVRGITWCGRPEKPHLLESGGNGVALFDADADGDLDLYAVSGWRLEGQSVRERPGNLFYLNRGDARFDDASARSGLADGGFGCGVEVGDVDGDGAIDVFVTRFGPDALYRGHGDARFEAVADAPGIDGWSAGAALFDADRDGDLDLYVAGYIRATMNEVLTAEPTLDWRDTKVMFGPFGMEGELDRYFENDGRGRFHDATAAAGLEDVGSFFGFGVLACDLDDDADLDLYVANDSNPNYLYRNDGSGHFQDVGLWSGAALEGAGRAQAGMGVAAGDVDGDGKADLVVTNFAEDFTTLYLNRGDCAFRDASRARGVAQPTYAPLSWGVVLEDFDLDGWRDLFIANGHIYPQADTVADDSPGYAQSNLLLSNDGKAFHDVSTQAGPGLALRASSRGVAAGDLDGDGDVDLVVSNVDAPPSVLRNDGARRGHWLAVEAPAAVRVEVRCGERRAVRHQVYGGSFCSVSDRRLHFGLGAAERVDAVRAVYGDGSTREVRDVAVDRVLRLGR